MNVIARCRACALAALVSVAACSGGGRSVPGPVAPLAPAMPAGTPGAAHGSAIPYGQGLLRGATYVGPARVDTVGLDIYPVMRDAAGLVSYAKDANDPHSGNYRHWLTPQQIGDRFGASQTDYQALVRALNLRGIAVKLYPQREMVRIRGPQANVEAMLGAHFGIYTSAKQTFLALSSAPHPPGGLPIAAFGNAVALRVRSRNFVPVRVGNGFIDGYSAQQLANAFDYTSAYNAGFTGKGINIGIIGTGPITDGDPRIDGGNGGDVAEYRKLFGLGGSGTVQQVYDLNNVSPGNTTAGPGSEFSTGLASPPPVTDPNAPGCANQNVSAPTDFTTCNPEDLEAQLDTEQASGLAPDANVLFFIAYNPMECGGPCGATGSSPPTQEMGIDLTDDEIQQAIADGRSDVLSLSFNGSEATSEGFYFGSGSNGFGPTELASVLAEGTAILVASGDNGAEGCFLDGSANTDSACVGYPSTDPSAVSVGGVNTPLNAAGQLTGPMTAWGEFTQISGTQPGGTGGGCSIFFPEPAYASGVPNLPCGGMRTQPDVSLDADVATGVTVVQYASPTFSIGRQIVSVGGTSAATPELAAMWALVLQACKQAPSCANGSGAFPWRLGNPNTSFYQIYQNAQQYGATFYDVQFGNNSLPSSGGSGQDPGFTAGIGYDLTTGLGVPFARSLIRTVTGQ